MSRKVNNNVTSSLQSHFRYSENKTIENTFSKKKPIENIDITCIHADLRLELLN